MSATLEMLADGEHLNPEMKDWRDKLCEMAYDIEDCVDTFIARVDRDGSKGFKGLFRKIRSLKVRYKIGNKIEELKRRVANASERHKRYNFVPSTHNSNTSSIDPRLSALYEDIKNLVAIDHPKKHIIELLNMEMNSSSSTKVEVVLIYGCGGLGKTTLAKQVYESIKGQFSCSAFVSISQNPNWIKILRDIAKGLGITDNTQDDDVTQLVDKLRKYLHGKRVARKLSFKDCLIYKVPSWMGSLGNLRVLRLQIICLRPEGVEILGAIPSLLFLKLVTVGGSKGQIILHGSSGFRSLTYFYLHIMACGSSLEFEAGAMPMLEQLKLRFQLHKMECLNSASNFFVRHLSALSKVEITIEGDCTYDYEYDPATDTDDTIVRCVASGIKAEIETLPKCPTLSFQTRRDSDCEHFECGLRVANNKEFGDMGGVCEKRFDGLEYHQRTSHG
ncbi:hypothetical protein ACP4OV_026793 [Aristida adscensionis]